MPTEADRIAAIERVSLFILTMCEPSPSTLVTRGEFYAAYVQWVDDQNEKAALADAGHEDDPDWISAIPDAPLRSAVFHGALPAALARVLPKTYASRELIDGVPKGQRGYKGVKLKPAVAAETPPTSERGVGMRPELALPYRGVAPEAMLAAMERAFREGYAAGFAAGQDEDGTSLASPAWEEFKSRRSLPRPGEAMDLYERVAQTMTLKDAGEPIFTGRVFYHCKECGRRGWSITHAEGCTRMDVSVWNEIRGEKPPASMKPETDDSEREQDWHEPAPAGMKHIGELDTDGY